MLGPYAPPLLGQQEKIKVKQGQCDNVTQPNATPLVLACRGCLGNGGYGYRYRYRVTGRRERGRQGRTWQGRGVKQFLGNWVIRAMSPTG